MENKLSYLHPHIIVSAELKSPSSKGGKITVSVPKYTCRESVISKLWSNVIEQRYEVMGVHITMDFPMGPPKEMTAWDQSHNPLYLNPDCPPLLEINKFTSNKRLQQRFLELATLCAIVPALQMVGPSVLSGGKNTLAFNDKPMMTMKMGCFTAKVLKHPVIISIILGQLRWLGDLLVNGELRECLMQLKPATNLKRLLETRKRGRLSIHDRMLLKVLTAKMVRLSDNKMVSQTLDRYSINVATSPFLDTLFKEVSSLEAPMFDTWKKEKGDNIYGISTYGIYRWASRRGLGLAKPLTIWAEKAAYNSYHVRQSI